MLGIDFLIGFGIGIVISACVMVFYHFAENDISILQVKTQYLVKSAQDLKKS